eukprot:SAG22_NODE_782_length_7256_cov_8.627498_5_plen_656_part_00
MSSKTFPVCVLDHKGNLSVCPRGSSGCDGNNIYLERNPGWEQLGGGAGALAEFHRRRTAAFLQVAKQLLGEALWQQLHRAQPDLLSRVRMFGLSVSFDWLEHRAPAELLPAFGKSEEHRAARTLAQLTVAADALQLLLPAGAETVDLPAIWKEQAANHEGGLECGGFVCDRVDFNSIFVLDNEQPIVNGRNHYTSLTGKHLYYYASGSKWFFTNTLDPTKSTAVAWVTADGLEVPRGRRKWQLHANSKWVEVELTINPVTRRALAEAEAAAQRRDLANTMEAAEQALRCGGLEVAGLAGNRKSFNTVYARDPDNPDANGRPHYSNPEGSKHLYWYAATSKWFFSNSFEPARSSAVAWVAADGAVPTNDQSASWTCHIDSSWQNLQLTITEVSREVVEAARQAAQAAQQLAAAGALAQAERCGGLIVEGLPSSRGAFNTCYTVDQEAPTSNGRPHYVSTTGKHLYYFSTGKWFLSNVHDPAQSSAVAWYETDGAVPTGAAAPATWQVHADGGWSALPLTITETSADVAEAARRAEAEALEEAGLRAWAQLERLGATGAIEVSGIPAARRGFNGRYTYVEGGDAHGKPHYASRGGKHLYWYGPTGKWFLSNSFTPDTSAAVAWIEESGAVPTETSTWQVHADGAWSERQLVISEVLQ